MIPLNMPVLETPRLILRPFTEDDAPALHEVNRLPEVMRFIAPVEQSVDDTLAYLKQGPLADYAKYGYGRHALIDKASGTLIGFCGLKYLPDLDDVDIGYRMLPEYWGQGLATEASEVLMDYARNTLGLTRVIALALPDNHGSIAVMKKLGLVYEGTVEYLNDICALYAWNASDD
ncbi:GNAT family N-acetyltransferase [Aestuariibacter halophilus]|uniref:GNAT family N-acetyltransferase n=1 Tax=Fluctibacter halophilus TaxID=226011 RepID=A0ABS8G7V0_9ALTE|nr:GNAT family N-acetyltransferase [Aestuariibacter halophilus]MCC2616503.1 GNAT family N-acetyltransferase [Aestuariibacter halophilus]